MSRRKRIVSTALITTRFYAATPGEVAGQPEISPKSPGRQVLIMRIGMSCFLAVDGPDL
jgi:hypothetical protein